MSEAEIIELLATPTRAQRARRMRKNSEGGHEVGWCNVVMIFFYEKNVIFSTFFMRMVRHLGFTMETRVYHGPPGRPFHICGTQWPAKAKGSGTHRNSY